MAFRALRLVAPKLARGYAVEGSGAAPFIVQAFANQQAKFKALSDSSEKLTPPADDAGWSKFASDYNTLKVKAGVAAPEDRLFDTLASLRDSTDSVRDYLSKAMELRVGADIADRNGAAEKLSLALAKVEVGLGGKPLLFSDDKGMTAFEAELKTIESTLGAGSVDAAWAEAQKQETAAEIASFKASRAAALERAMQGTDMSH